VSRSLFGDATHAHDKLGTVTKAGLIAVGLLLLLTACRVDVAVHVDMNENGSGNVLVEVTTDADVVAQAEGLAEDLRFDDLTAAGWVVDGPATTPSGGLAVSMQHSFDTPEQATALLATLSGTDGPLRSVSFSRTATVHDITYTVAGSARVDSLSAFADSELIAAVGGTPYVDDIAAAGLSADEAVNLTLTVTLPGTVATSTATPDENGAITWTIPVDGVQVDLAATTAKSLERGGIWPVLSNGAFFALIVWGVLSVVAIIGIARARRRRSRRRR
jgi:hypothetical protein